MGERDESYCPFCGEGYGARRLGIIAGWEAVDELERLREALGRIAESHRTTKWMRDTARAALEEKGK